MKGSGTWELNENTLALGQALGHLATPPKKMPVSKRSGIFVFNVFNVLREKGKVMRATGNQNGRKRHLYRVRYNNCELAYPHLL